MDCSTPDFHVLHHLPEFALTHVHWVGDVIQPFHLLLSPSPPAFNLSQHEVCFLFFFPSELPFHIRWPKYWYFSFSISPFSEYSGVISFSIDWFDLLAVQGTLSVQEYSQAPQFKGINSLELSLFIVQLSYPYMTTGKTHSLSIWSFVNKVMSLLF